ncbi:uncharacterized protein LOC133170834 [Syngnathus typhle]|uniref:uncharacterized protein LOC133170834 n=1 Tax=Syngnathus typhle TaxID=161592 RepID=UPI002A6A8522|nr:uncharacterized protein LOC133170834 [Syngnathus typhle]
MSRSGSPEVEVARSHTEDVNVQIMAEQLLRQHIATRKGKLSFCTRKQNELKQFMDNASVADIDKGIKDLIDALDEFDKAHVLVQDMLAGYERQEDHAQWYEPKKKSFLYFLENAQTFKGSLSQPLPVITPMDSASNTSRKSGSSSKSGAPSLSSARVKIEAEKAALLERAAGLKKKHALELQRMQLQGEIEQSAIEIDIAAANAKVKVLENYEKQIEIKGGSVCRSEPKDSMNSYLEAHGKETYIEPEISIEYANIHTVPKTPLQMLTAQRQTQFPYQLPSKQPQTIAATSITAGVAAPSIPTAAASTPNTVAATSAPTVVVATPAPTTAAASLTSHSAQPIKNSGLSDIANLFMQQQRLSLLPTRDIPVFDGEPLNFRPFMLAFVHRIENKAISNQDRLYYLEQYTSGQSKELVRSCLHMSAGDGYAEAKRLLEYHYGDKIKLTNAYMEKAMNWSTIKAEDGKALYSYALFLRACCNLSRSLQDMEELSLPSNLRLLVSKLPIKLRERWRSRAFDIMEQRQTKATFSDLVTFIERHARIMQDPLFGDIQQPLSTKKFLQPKPTSDSKLPFKTKGSFVTAVANTSASAKNDVPKQQSANNKSPVTSSCAICNETHSLTSCKELLSKTHEERVDILKRKGVCFGCLVKGHLSKDCKRRLTCSVCSKRHPDILHIQRTADGITDHKGNPSGSEMAINSGLVSLENGNIGSSDDHCTLAIVPVQVKLSKSNHVVQTYAFLDPGSSATFCTESLRRRLNARGRNHRILLRTMGQEKPTDSIVVSGLEVSSLEGKLFYGLPDVYTQKEIPVSKGHIPKQKDVKKWPHLKDVFLPTIDADIDLLIGTNVPKLMEPWRVINSNGNGPFATKTLLGWVVSGLLHDEHTSLSKQGKTYVYTNRISVEIVRDLLVQQLNHDFPESTYEKEEMSQEDLRFLNIMNTSVKVQDGHYQLPLPFKGHPRMPNNRMMAAQRAELLRRKFGRNTIFWEEYTLFMNTMVKCGHAELVPNQEEPQNGKGWYIPHHGVRHPKKGNLRVVFDCSASYQGTSLNNELLKGPNLANSLIGVLLRFCHGNVAILADVEKMYHQVKIPPEHVDFLRFLWWEDGNTSQPLMQYRMTVHIFGATSSASCASYALKRTAEDNKGSFSAEAVNTVLNNFYVDDLLKSVDTETDAIQLCKELKALCAAGGFNLTKWSSNSRNVLVHIPECERAKGVKDLDLDLDDLPLERTFGVHWSAEDDVFKFHVALKEQPCTRRGILSTVSSIYDPLGFLAPVTFPAKHLLQELCKLNLTWDEDIPNTHAQSWKRWLHSLRTLTAFNITRSFKPKNFGKVEHAQLHHFCDASEVGYGMVTYLRLVSSKEQVHVKFVIGKSRVAPLKFMTIPRLELTAAVLAVRVEGMLVEELKMDLEPAVFWTDSTTVLKYIKNDNRRFHTFVANRVNTIRSRSDVLQWKHIPGKLNPADYASRGLNTADFLKGNNWINGPKFLKDLTQHWPNVPVDLAIPPDDSELRREVQVHATLASTHDPTSVLLNYFSTWNKLRRAVAWFLKLRSLLTQCVLKRKGASKADMAGPKTLSVQDLEEAEEAIVKFCQNQGFPQEMASLHNGRNVNRKSSIFRLDPVLDHGLLRVGGRLSRMAMPEVPKHPAILPKRHHVSELLLQHIHQQVGHCGRNHILASLRQKYWIPCANSLAREIVNNCVPCRRNFARAGEQKMADLPIDRLTPDLPPFSHVGVDYFGPIEVRRGRGMAKRYGVLFTCLTTRAVHLEVAHSLDTDSCVNAFRRFIARRGQVKELRSDNGTNLISAEKELREALKRWNMDQIERSLIQKGVKWTFNPPAGAHHGGIWERIIRMVKRILSSITNQQSLDDEGLVTVMCEVESILNSRPLTTVSSDPNDLEPLTPNHLLQLKVQPVLPPGTFKQEDLYARRRWRQTQYIADLFWTRWIREYVPLMQERSKWSRIRPNFGVGDIVVIADPTAPRGSWVIGRVIEAIADYKGLVRSVRLQTRTNQLLRPISKIYLLVKANNQH